MHKLIYIIPALFIAGITHAQPIFTADFEDATLDDMAVQWNEAKNLSGMAFSDDVPPGSPGTQSLMMTAEIGQNTGGHLYKMFPDGFDSLYARFYVKFSPTHSPVHHFVHMGGYNPPTRWPQGGAGERPVGNERFTTGIEPFGDNWSWDFYSYWMHMRGNPVPNRYWGNNFLPQPPAPVTRGEWQCVEFMMKCNDPVNAFNGEQAFWVDGKKVLHLQQGSPRGYWVWDTFHHHPDSAGFEGFQWRSDPDLRVNFFWLLYYMTAGPNGQRDTVWFDDVVISTEYIGPHGTTAALTAQQSSETFSMVVYPNPARGIVTLELNGSGHRRIRLDLFDTYGRHVWSSSGSMRTTSIQVDHLPPGYYQLVGSKGGEVQSRSVLIY